jgi:translation elongation factor EF-1beta
MGEVVIKYRIIPEGEYLDKIEEILEKIKQIKGFKEAKIEDIGFGIKAILAVFLVNDDEGNIVDKELEKIEGIQFETVEVSLL